MSAATATAAMILVVVPPPRPRRSKTVAVASTAMMARNVSHPIDRNQLTMPGSFCPWTPNAARLSTIVGTEPRLPAIAMIPHSRNDTGMPMSATTSACQKETPKP